METKTNGAIPEMNYCLDGWNDGINGMELLMEWKFSWEWKSGFDIGMGII